MTEERVVEAPRELKQGQTVCNRKDEKGKLCAGPLKRQPRADYRSQAELEGQPGIYRCGHCYMLYTGPPLGYLRAPEMEHFVLTEPPDVVQPPPAPAHEPAKKEAPPKPAAAPEAESSKINQ